MPPRILDRLRRKARTWLEPDPCTVFALTPSLPLLTGVPENDLQRFLASVRPANASLDEMSSYFSEAFRRFLYTYGLARDLTGKALELGANPYFLTMLLKHFTPLDLTLSNYFGPHPGVSMATQEVLYQDWGTKQRARAALSYHHFNAEEEPFPFPAATFDVVFFCEILEHLLRDPLTVLREIKRVLRPGGTLILTTPNVCRLENRARLLAGQNIYDPYSGHGPYGRHNREYTCDEVQLVLRHAGFEIDSFFTADVHDNHANRYVAVSQLAALLPRDGADLGQYIFVRARSDGAGSTAFPDWLYRGFTNEQDNRSVRSPSPNGA